MGSPACIYALIYAPHERLEAVLLDALAPIAFELRDRPELDSLFFVRFSEPRWQLRFRVLGEPEWIEGPVRGRLDQRLATLTREGGVESHTFATYDREIERYGGPAGMKLAERLFTVDSFAALELCAADRAGSVRKSRREIAMVLVERLLDVAGFTHAQKLALYRHGYQWALDNGDWTDAELRVLEARYAALRPGFERLFSDDPPLAGAGLWGGETAEAIGERFLREARPLVEQIRVGLAAGTIRQDPIYLFWSYAHMFTNRMGIESSAEAVLRFFMHRFHQERQPVPR